MNNLCLWRCWGTLKSAEILHTVKSNFLDLVLLGHILSVESWVIECFGSLIIQHPCLATQPGVISPRLVNKWHSAPQIPLRPFQQPPECPWWLFCSAVLWLQGVLLLLMASKALPPHFNWLKAGSSSHCSNTLETRSVHLAPLCSLASSLLWSQGTVSSSRASCFVDTDVITMSTWSEVVADFCWELELPS